MSGTPLSGSLLSLARRSLDVLNAPALEPFLDAWPSRTARDGSETGSAVPRERGRGTLPVLRWLPKIAAAQNAFEPDFVNALCAAAPTLEWRQTYTLEETGAAFLENYGWTELLGPKGLRTAANISCGLIVLGPDTLYPHHRHEAEEIYVPLSGTAAWQQGDAVWRERAPGTVIHHLSEEPHAMRTREEPLLAMYLWRSENLDQEARLDRRRAG
jgi:hypothetical protein